ncbi:N-terminal binuclear Zn cluster-containing/DNA binding domain-containing protein [Trichoderma cornu-damae]|uniref:N-terminal binuclear Zn cluster-containing/DNA binding domain-containing protein n=1 Tax=Trichoderma cornu-damae TaxID=654480 RepID=A0A9P8QJ67_9HYPO|nr:N-terminal binuclear Zn cluster-containing/DNA binding domain-containing protein [Trichoderma cornu-damae]
MPQESQDPGHEEDLLPSSSSSSSLPSPTPRTRFFGESSFLTLIPGDDGGIPAQSHISGGSGSSNNQKPRFTFPILANPRSTSQAAGGGTGLSSGTMRYLRDEGALTLPDLRSCLPAFEAYFAWFHPSYPILDRVQVARRLLSASSFSSVDMSRILLQAMLFIGATYCDAGTIRAMGFQDRSQAKTAFYTRARLLFHADWEKDQTVLIQSLFLMSFWRGGPADGRYDKQMADNHIPCRSRSMSKDSHTARMRRRIWWSIYVRRFPSLEL